MLSHLSRDGHFSALHELVKQLVHIGSTNILYRSRAPVRLNMQAKYTVDSFPGLHIWFNLEVDESLLRCSKLVFVSDQILFAAIITRISPLHSGLDDFAGLFSGRPEFKRRGRSQGNAMLAADNKPPVGVGTAFTRHLVDDTK